MAISFGASRAWAYAASGNVTPTLATHATGNMLLVHVAYKSSAIATAAASTATSGWNKLGEFHDGTVNSGNGTGSVAVAVFYKEATSSSETAPAVTFSQATTQVGHSALTFTKGGSDTWATPLGQGTAEGTTTTTWSETMPSHIPSVIGDALVSFIASRDDSAFEATATRPTISQTGVTATKAPATAGLDGSGADGSYDSSYAIATADSTGAHGVGTTCAAVETGSIWLTVLHVTVSGNVTVTPTTAALVATKFAPTVTASDHQLVTVSPAGGAGYAATVLTDSPAGYWRMGEASGSVLDSIGSNHGTASGTVTRDVAGALAAGDDGAITFGGGYVRVTDHAALDLADVVTVEAWVNVPVSAGDKGIVGKDTGTYYIRLDASTNKLTFIKANIAVIVQSTSNVPGTGWHHVAATKNGATVKLYIDGADVTGTVTNATLVDNALDLYIGAADTVNEKMTGSIDEAAVYGTALSAARILAHYTAGTTAGGLVLTTYAPTVTVAAPQLVTPTTATVVLATFAPAVTFTDNQLVTPTTKAAVLATFAPSVTATDLQLVTPTTKALTLATFAPLVSTPELATPSTVSLALTTFAPSISVTDNQAVTPTTKALVLATFAPTVTATDPQLVTPTTTAVTLTTFAPTVSAAAHQQVTPSTVALTLQAFAPTVTASDQQTVTPTTRALTLAAFAPTVLTPELVTPTTRALALATFAPTVSNPDPQLVTPTTKTLSLATFAPSVGVSDAASIVPPNASLSLTTYAPTVIQPDPQLVTPTTPALELHTFEPVISATAHQAVTPTTAVLVTTRHIPTVAATANQSATPATKALTLTAYAPQVTVNNIVATVTIGLTLTTFAPSVTAGTNTYAFPDPASLVLTGYAPFIDLSAFKLVTPTTAALVITTYPPTAEQHSITPLPTPIYGFAVIATGPGAGVGSASGGATVTTSEGGSTAVSSSGPSARVTIR